MIAPAPPDDEEARLHALQQLELLDTPAEERFDRIVRLACRALATPVALISLIDSARQWFKAACGLDATETSRDVSFCGHAILRETPLVVNDALLDERFADNPLVLGPPGIRFYAGQPIASQGHRVGTLCVIDTLPRSFSTEDRHALSDLAALVERELLVDSLGAAERALRRELSEVERRAAMDSLTRVWSRETILRVATLAIADAQRLKEGMAVAMIDIDKFKQVNDSYGHPVGDQVIRTVAERLRSAMRAQDSLGRYGGEEFLAVLAKVDARNAVAICDRMRQKVAATPIQTTSGPIHVTVSVGVQGCPRDRPFDMHSLVVAADNSLYVAKRGGRNRVHSQPPKAA